MVEPVEILSKVTVTNGRFALVTVTGVGGTTTSAQFTYNGDGQKVKSVINGCFA
jgi:flagellar biosynthesis GTPase FlhF